MKQQSIILVIDGLGIGEFEHYDNKHKCNTLQSISNIYDLNNTIFDLNYINLNLRHQMQDFYISYGCSKLDHSGADSYLGHKEIICDDYSSEHLYIEDFYEKLKKALDKKYVVRFDYHCIIINDCVAISNNVESDIGLNINVLGILDLINFEEIFAIGQLVKKIINPSRVIIMGGKPLDLKKIQNSIISRYDQTTKRKVYGIKIPKTGIYNEHYQVYHLTKDSAGNIIDSFINENKSVALLGKTADMFNYKEVDREHIVNTEKLLARLIELIKENKYDFIFANIQELDLAGHAQDVNKAAIVIKHFLNYLPQILSALTNGILIVTADHGNDPTCGHSYHTREMVPIYLFSKEMQINNIGIRNSLSDIGASICKYNNLKSLGVGKTFI